MTTKPTRRKTTTEYDRALKRSNGQVGTCTGDEHLAVTVSLLCRVHAINPSWLFLGAKNAGQTGSSLTHATAAELDRLQWLGCP